MNRVPHKNLARPLAGLSAGAIVLALAFITPARAGLTECAFDEKSRTLTIQGTRGVDGAADQGAGVTLDSHEIVQGERNPYPKILVYDNPWLRGNPLGCSHLTVDQVDVIKFDWPDDSLPEYDWNNRHIAIDLSHGPFAPGFTNEAGTSDEIEFEFQAGGPDTTGHTVNLYGGTGPNNWAIGTSGINLNASESAGVDADLTISGAPASEIRILALGELGNDRISLAGGSGTGGSRPSVHTNTYPCFANLCGYGGDGNDTFVASTGAEVLAGEGGTDTIDYSKSGPGLTVDLQYSDPSQFNFQDTGGSDMDRLIGIENLLGTGFRDVFKGNVSANAFKGGSGNDRLIGRDGDDRLDGGAGTDDCAGGVGTDVLIRCE